VKSIGKDQEARSCNMLQSFFRAFAWKGRGGSTERQSAANDI